MAEASPVLTESWLRLSGAKWRESSQLIATAAAPGYTYLRVRVPVLAVPRLCLPKLCCLFAPGLHVSCQPRGQGAVWGPHRRPWSSAPLTCLTVLSPPPACRAVTALCAPGGVFCACPPTLPPPVLFSGQGQFLLGQIIESPL